MYCFNICTQVGIPYPCDRIHAREEARIIAKKDLLLCAVSLQKMAIMVIHNFLSLLALTLFSFSQVSYIQFYHPFKQARVCFFQPSFLHSIYRVSVKFSELFSSLCTIISFVILMRSIRNIFLQFFRQFRSLSHINSMVFSA